MKKTFYDYLNDDNKKEYEHLLADKKLFTKANLLLGVAVAGEIEGDVGEKIGETGFFDYVVKNGFIDKSRMSDILNYKIHALVR